MQTTAYINQTMLKRFWWRRGKSAPSLIQLIVQPFVLLGVLSLVGSMIAFMVFTTEARNHALNQTLVRILGTVEERLDTHAASLRTSSQLLADTPNIVTALQGELNLQMLDELALQQQLKFDLDQVEIYTASGRQLVDIARSSSMSGMSPAKQGMIAAGCILPFQTLIQPTGVLLIHCAPIQSATGEQLGLVLTTRLLDAIALSQLRPDPTDQLLLVANNTVLASTVPGVVDLPTGNTINLLGQRYGWQAKPWTSATTDLQVIALRSTAETDYVTIAGLRALLGSSILTFTILVVLALLLARLIARPVTQLASFAESMAAGKLQPHVIPAHVREFEILSRTLNTAADNLAAQFAGQQRKLDRERAIVQNLADGVIVIDSSGAVLITNPAAATLLCDVPTEAETVHTKLRETLHTGQPFSTELRLGDQLIQFSTTLIRLARDEQGAIAVLHDITAAAAAEQLKTDFIGIASHELRTPLTTMRGYLALLRLSGLEQTIAPAQQQMLQGLYNGTEHLVALVNDLLDLSRLEAGKFEYEPTPTDVETSVREVMRSLEPTINDKQHDVTLRFPLRLPPVLMDSHNLRRVILNLLSNAVKYTPTRGLITIAAHANAQHITIEVSDSGVGIATDELPRLFGRFFRSDNPYIREREGTGLGLSITKTLVELHQGTITVDSTLGVGTTFIVNLPIAPVALIPAPKESTTHALV